MGIPEFKELYDMWSQYVYSLSYRLTGNRVDAEDLAQEAFLKAFRFLKDFQGGSIKGWLYKIVVNTFYTETGKKKRQPLPLEEEVLRQKQEEGIGPQEVLDKTEMQVFIQNVVASLPADYRTALVLADMEELSYQEIADILQVPIGTVRSRIARGRSILKEKLLQLNFLERRKS
jgi:RNA polymerase sigma-70 factor (ECF subfamily)